MKQNVKMLVAMLLIAMCLTSDTAVTSAAPTSARLGKLRKHWPEAPILGESEVDTSSSHAPVRVSPAMNALRKRMSDLP